MNQEINEARKALLNLGPAIKMAATKAGIIADTPASPIFDNLRFKPFLTYPRIPFTKTILWTTGILIILTLIIGKV